MLARQISNNATSQMPANAKPSCGGGALDPTAEYLLDLHIVALFVILITSTLGNSLLTVLGICSDYSSNSFSNHIVEIL